AVGADEHVLDVLLGDRGPTAGGVLAHDVVAGRARETGDRETGIAVEVAVLRRQHGVADVLGDLRDTDLETVALRRDDPRDLGGVVGRVDPRELVRLHVRRGRHLRRVVGGGEDSERYEHGENERDEYGVANDASPSLLRCGRGGARGCRPFGARHSFHFLGTGNPDGRVSRTPYGTETTAGRLRNTASVLLLTSRQSRSDRRRSDRVIPIGATRGTRTPTSRRMRAARGTARCRVAATSARRRRRSRPSP